LEAGTPEYREETIRSSFREGKTLLSTKHHGSNIRSLPRAAAMSPNQQAKSSSPAADSDEGGQ
jgi:hypothetical protein